MQVTLSATTWGNKNKAVRKQAATGSLGCCKDRNIGPLGEFEAQETATILQQRWTACSLLHNQRTRREHGGFMALLTTKCSGVWVVLRKVRLRSAFVEQIIEDCVVAGYLKPSQKLSKLNLNTPFTARHFRSSGG